MFCMQYYHNQGLRLQDMNLARENKAGLCQRGSYREQRVQVSKNHERAMVMGEARRRRWGQRRPAGERRRSSPAVLRGVFRGGVLVSRQDSRNPARKAAIGPRALVI